ncbi:MAG: DNA alkylation repair enzyme [bacterium ADurb.Bin243]|nr:MAG: DNA alkylation repair enzyme [bacterium ADurb.Bin243]HOD40898.1 DNA alkylation repair protein [Candidatus Wallbacteria bacterium]
MPDVIKRLRSLLKAGADDKIKETARRFFKEEVKVYGFKTAEVTKVGKELLKELKEKQKAEIFELCEELWRSGYMEESFIACAWAYSLRAKFEPADFRTFEKWAGGYVSNWASCDTLCNHTIGTFVEMYPEYIDKLKKWAVSKNRWMRRAAAVSLIVPARKGKFLAEIFEISDILLMDGDDLVQKGYGWMLKSASQAYRDEVFKYVMSKKAVMPRTALRYAIEKMPQDMRKKAMEK